MEFGPSLQNNSRSRQSNEYNISACKRKGTPLLLFRTRQMGPSNYELLEMRLKFFQQNYTNLELVTITDKNTTTSNETEHISVRKDCVIEVRTLTQSNKLSSESPRLQHVVNLSTDELNKTPEKYLSLMAWSTTYLISNAFIFLIRSFG